MNPLLGANILSVEQFDLATIAHIFRVADQMAPYARREKRTKVLDGAILGNLFFEPSTRTRVSFGTAFNLLGGDVRETTGVESSALAKGESLYDSARVLSSYSDIIAMRHPKAGSVAEFSEGSRVPVINGGDGANEHPTQALLDLYTIQKELQHHGKDLANMHICMLGDLKHGRTVHSLARLLALYPAVRFTLIAPAELQMPDSIRAVLDNAGHSVQICHEMSGSLDADIVYQTRLQQERFDTLSEAAQYQGRFRLNQAIFTKHYQPNTVIMHPLPRDSRATANELDNDLNQHPNLAIFRQADNGVLIRMALFALALGVEHLVSRYDTEVVWFSQKAQH